MGYLAYVANIKPATVPSTHLNPRAPTKSPARMPIAFFKEKSVKNLMNII
jgi:hypothetical protein